MVLDLQLAGGEVRKNGVSTFVFGGLGGVPVRVESQLAASDMRKNSPFYLGIIGMDVLRFTTLVIDWAAGQHSGLLFHQDHADTGRG